MALTLIAVPKTANAFTFQKGTNTLSAGLGFSSYLPINIAYERGIYDINSTMSIGVGGIISNSIVGANNVFSIAAQCNYHFTGVDNFDFSGGAVLGFRSVSNHGGEFSFGLQAEAKYYFTDKFGVFLNFGIPFVSGFANYGMAGVVFKF